MAAIGSVAGDRGRKGDPCYGASKAALHAWLQGMRHRLQGSGVGVTTIKPGWVRTRMLGDVPGFPAVDIPGSGGGLIVRAIDAGRDDVLRAMVVGGDLSGAAPHARSRSSSAWRRHEGSRDPRAARLGDGDPRPLARLPARWTPGRSAEAIMDARSTGVCPSPPGRRPQLRRCRAQPGRRGARPLRHAAGPLLRSGGGAGARRGRRDRRGRVASVLAARMVAAGGARHHEGHAGRVRRHERARKEPREAPGPSARHVEGGDTGDRTRRGAALCTAAVVPDEDGACGASPWRTCSGRRG